MTDDQLHQWARQAITIRGANVLRRFFPPPDAPPAPPAVPSPYLTAEEAAAYLRISYGTFRNHAHKIPKTRHGRYRIADLDKYAAGKRK
mgnify:CR=1 FL=1